MGIGSVCAAPVPGMMAKVNKIGARINPYFRNVGFGSSGHTGRAVSIKVPEFKGAALFRIEQFFQSQSGYSDASTFLAWRQISAPDAKLFSVPILRYSGHASYNRFNASLPGIQVETWRENNRMFATREWRIGPHSRRTGELPSMP